jgi:hypothetical protein
MGPEHPLAKKKKGALSIMQITHTKWFGIIIIKIGSWNGRVVEPLDFVKAKGTVGST